MTATGGSGSCHTLKDLLEMFFQQQDILSTHLAIKKDLHLGFVKALDSVCKNDQDIEDMLNDLKIYGVVPHTRNHTWLQKKLVFYIKQFQLDITDCPNLFFLKSSSAVSFLFKKRYMDKSISSEAWEELTYRYVSHSSVLQEELYSKLVSAGDTQAAMNLAQRYNLKQNCADLLQLFHITSTYNNEPESSSLYLTLRLSRSQIKMVDTPETFREAVDDILKNKHIGVDTEWAQDLVFERERKYSLLQLAVWNSIYLFDIPALKNCLTSDMWDMLIHNVFDNPRMLILGYGTRQQLDDTLDFFRSLNRQYKCSSVSNLRTMFQQMKEDNPEKIKELEDSAGKQVPNIHELKGLSQLCATVLGKPLDKREQISDWTRRPLREKQIMYAALDAYCLLLIYMKLRDLLEF